MSKVEKTVAQTAVLMVLLNLGCKAIGFLREMVMATFYGTGYVADSLVMAQSIPNIILGGVLVAVSTAYMPLFSKRVEGKGEKAGNSYTSQVILILVILSFFTALAGIIFSKTLVNIMAWGFDEQAKNLTAFYLKITFGYTVFSSVVGIYASYLQYKGSFVVQILGDYLQNICYIIMIIVSASVDNRLLALGLFLGYAARCFFLAMLAKKKGFCFSIDFTGIAKNSKEIIGLSIPVFIGTMLLEVNTFVDRTLASGLGSGSISALNYAHQINTIVISLSITILTTIIYPKLVQLSRGKNQIVFMETIQRGFGLMLLIAVPLTLGSVMYGESIIKLIYERGVFDGAATKMTGAAYVFYATGVVFQAISDYMTKVYYSLHNMKTPMICSGIGMITNVILNLILVNYMQQNGLAFATSLAAMANAILQIFFFKKKYDEITLIKSKSKAAVIVVASALSVMVSYAIYHFLMEQITNEVIGLALAIVVAGCLYILFLKLFKIEELNYIVSTLIRRKM